MKKNYLLLIILFASYSVNAQNETDSYQKNNEIKLNALAPLWQSFQVSYERHLNHNSSLGLSFYNVFDNTKNEKDLNYYFSPYYRRYFGKKYSSGWFVEGFGMLASTDGKKIYTSEDHSIYTENPDVINFALGAGGGWKWVSKSGFLFEANVGYGGILINADKIDHTIVAKFGLSAGYRF
ncbi:uncharacterized protein DUF3575 [Flavobacterium cutihirudinis]|uniref:Uncharacterized protein DUF3575 n=1 Tax=Flavobacterium cutihirudinis TaxID=1265740 RepID=A0A3D9FP72_9FLAO|nr:DUF3575 domain-containing protein [Flavobacterium cutihirudinis]RED22110.1 uncharacterized protein DUF3575 [Flavobacterium cutihirudinis]